MSGKIPRPPYRSYQRKSDLPILRNKLLKPPRNPLLHQSYQKHPTNEDIQSSTILSPNKHQTTQQQIQRNNFTSNSTQVVHDMISVLKEENVNLKEQNSFLLEKLRGLSKREEEMRERAGRNERLAKEIRRENEEIKGQIQEVNEIANSKIEEFGRKLVLLGKSHNWISERGREYQQEEHIEPEAFQNVMQSRSEVYNNKSQGVKEISTPDKQKNIDVLSKKFQSLLKLCKQEKNAENKKELRRKLLEVSNRMREIRQQY